MVATTVHCEIDPDAVGRQIGRPLLPHSPDDDAWGSIAVPIAAAANGNGPCVLVLGGVHGDEYAGPIVIARLLREIDPVAVSGRIILVPVANVPALRAGWRNADIDGHNLARVFPGNHRGGPTERIAACLHDHLMAGATHSIDLHTGGRSLAILSWTQVLLTLAVDEVARAELLAIAQATELPIVISHSAGDNGTSVGVAVNHGVRAVALELGEGAHVTMASVELAAAALQRAFVAIRVLRGDAGRAGLKPRCCRMGIWRDQLTAPCDGWFERGFRLGEKVAAGQFAGRMHDLLMPKLAPVDLHFSASGTIYAHRCEARVRAGGSLAVLVREEDA